MTFSLSPSVHVKETSIDNYVKNVATTWAGTVGFFNWGAIDEIILIDSEQDLVETFGKPNDSNFTDWFPTYNYLNYSSFLQVVRVVDTAVALNAGAGESSTTQGTFDVTNSVGYLIKNYDDWEGKQATIIANEVAFYAKYAGAMGNKIKVEAFDSTSYATSTYGEFFEYPPEGDDLFVAVLYAEDGVNYELIERFYTSKDPASINNTTARTNFVGDVINQTSKYIYINTPSVFTGTVGAYSAVDFLGNLSAGVDGNVAGSDGDNERMLGWDLFLDTEAIEVNLLITGGASEVASKYVLDSIATVRRDCVVFISPQVDDVVGSATPETDIITSRNTYGSSSYAVFDGNFKYQYDKYNDVNRWVALNGDIAGLCALTDYTNDAWWSPAGFTRGNIKNVTKLAFNPSKSQRDALYNSAVNPVTSFKGEGVVLFGDKTMQTKPDSFDRINVRRLFLVLEKSIATASKYQLFEFNDRITRENFVNMVEPFLRNVKARRGVYDYYVVCDETNNTGDVIDRNEFVAEIYIKPNKSINFIQLTFASVATGISFTEVLLNR